MTNDLLAVLHAAASGMLCSGVFLRRAVGTGRADLRSDHAYLGLSLGMAVALGYCAAFGTLMPPIFDCVARPYPFCDRHRALLEIARIHPSGQ